jgi:hypothetical protein
MQILLKACKKSFQKRRYNLPTAKEIATIIRADGSEKLSPHEIVVYLHDRLVKHISDLHQAYIPLYFILFFS